jgi:hypothetical protein
MDTDQLIAHALQRRLNQPRDLRRLLQSRLSTENRGPTKKAGPWPTIFYFWSR